MANFSLLNLLVQFLCAMALQSVSNWPSAGGYLLGGLVRWTDERGEKLQWIFLFPATWIWRNTNGPIS